MKKAVILLFSLSLLVFLSSSNGADSSKASGDVAQTSTTADHPILPPI
ncbi:hypothetical protein [Neobacillus sp. NPDC093127]|jgi:hypothetical protein